MLYEISLQIGPFNLLNSTVGFFFWSCLVCIVSLVMAVLIRQRSFAVLCYWGLVKREEVP